MEAALRHQGHRNPKPAQMSPKTQPATETGLLVTRLQRQFEHMDQCSPHEMTKLSEKEDSPDLYSVDIRIMCLCLTLLS